MSNNKLDIAHIDYKNASIEELAQISEAALAVLTEIQGITTKKLAQANSTKERAKLHNIQSQMRVFVRENIGDLAR